MVDIAAVSRLISTLQSLCDGDGDSFGGYGKVWENGTIDRYASFGVLIELCSTLFSLKNLDYWSDSPKIVSDARSTLRDLDGAKVLLEGLSASLEKTIMDIKKHIFPFELARGLASTPDEILSLIFEHANGIHSSDGRIFRDTKEELSLVCRRFRRVAVNSPRLWSNIGSSAKMPYVRACLQRSKTVGLSISLNLHEYAELQHVSSFLAAVVPHATRWEYFGAFFGRLTNSTRILPFLLNLRLPSLHSLCLTFLDCAILRDDDGHFYQSWEVPNLRSLDIDIIPRIFEAPNLSSVCFQGVSIDEGTAESERLKDFLSAFPKLEELDIVFHGRGMQYYQQAQLIEMPNLKHLSIGALYSYTKEICPFMVALRAPKLRKLDLHMSAPVSDDNGFRTLEDLFPHEDYSSMESLTLTMTSGESTQFYVPFQKLRSLRSLSLISPNLFPQFPDYNDGGEQDFGFVPALHTLKISDCGKGQMQMLSDLKTTLKSQGKWDSFRQLEVSSALNMRQLNALFGEADKNIIWRQT